MEETQKEIVKTKTPFYFYLILLLIFAFGFGLSIYLGRLFIPKSKNIEAKKEPVITSKPLYQYESKPPSRALTGTIEGIYGEVKKQPRDSDDWVEISTSSASFGSAQDKVLQGESFKLNNIGKATALFENQTTVLLGKNSEVSFINLIPEKFLLEQNNGVITFKNVKPISVKIFNSLMVLEAGEFTIDVNNETGRFNLSLASGSAKLSFVDEENETQVYELVKGDQAKYDPATKTVVIK